MPNLNSTFTKGYIARLKETLSSDEPAEIARMLGITYQAAKNYLEGRLPSAEVLITIAEKSDHSLNWLLTGQGAKKVASADSQSAIDEISGSEIKLVIRRMIREELDSKKGAPVIKVGEREKKRA